MGISAEFIVNLGPYEHVKLTLSDDNLMSIYGDSKEPFEEWLGDYHASLKAAVLYGRDRALNAVKLADETVKKDAPETAPQGAVELLTEQLGATVLEVIEEPQEAPSSPFLDTLKAAVGEVSNPLADVFKETPDRPWKQKPKPAKPKAWEDPVTEDPEATSKEARKAAADLREALIADASGWDF